MMLTSVILAKLIKYWSRSFGINCWYLGHHLTIIRMVLIILTSYRLLVWTNFIRAWTLSGIPVFTLNSLTWWIIISQIKMRIDEICRTALLIIDNSMFFKDISEIAHSISVISVKSVLSKYFHFVVSNLLGFLNLLWSQLNLGRIYCSWSSMVGCVHFVVWIYITIITVLFRWRSISIFISCFILLGNSILKLVDCNFI